jgi:hypothetical protein
MAMISPIAAAGIVVLAAPLLFPAPAGAVSQTAKSPLIVTRAAGERQTDISGKRVRRLIMAALARRGHDVLDGEVTPSMPGATILQVATDVRILPGAYIKKAVISVRATLVDGDTKRFLARFDLGPGTPWRLAAHCAKACIDQEVQRRIRPLAARIAADVHRQFVRLGRERTVMKADPSKISVAFRRIDRSLLPRIEQYLRNFPGVSRVRRDHAAGQGILYRLDHDGRADGTDLSLRKMLHHLQLKARIARTGNSYVVEADPAAQPAAGSQDW